MENYRLLEKHRKKLSIYFALFILFSLWITEGIFLLSNYVTHNIELEGKLETRIVWVKNIISNKWEYLQKIESNDYTIKVILEKTLDWVTIIENWDRILGNINHEIFIDQGEILNSTQYKFYQENFILNWNDYTVIIQSFNEYSYYKLGKEYWYFIIFSLPFMIFFYFIWYIFVWKNFRPIKETISSLETFSANINHEMKTPLAEIISTLSLAKKLKGNYDEAINQSLKSSKKLNKILDSMLWIINLVDSSYKQEKIDLVSELKEIIKENKTKAEKKNIKIKTDFMNKSYTIHINKEHYHICVWNILKNAIKYSHDNSKIKIKFEDWKIEVTDFGVWIEEKNLKNIFNRYFREDYIKEEWSWLWLALVKKIVDMHLWKIEIESKKDKWTKVTLTIV